jgi:hypothetical protein
MHSETDFMRMLARLVVRGFAVCVVALGLVGCSRDTFPLVPVQGIVTLDGQPVEGARVSFIPERAITAGGITDTSGRFTLMCRGRRGCPPGRSQVLISKQVLSLPDGIAADDRVAIEALPEGPQYIAVVPSQYGDPKRAEIIVDVHRGMPLPVAVELSSVPRP